MTGAGGRSRSVKGRADSGGSALWFCGRNPADGCLRKPGNTGEAGEHGVKGRPDGKK